MLLKFFLWLWLEESVFAATALPTRTGLRLLQPLGSASYLAPSPVGTVEIIYCYFNDAQQWIFGVAAGICILQVLIGGFMILNSGGDPSKRSEGVSKATWSIAGLLLLGVISLFLGFLNPDFYIGGSAPTSCP